MQHPTGIGRDEKMKEFEIVQLRGLVWKIVVGRGNSILEYISLPSLLLRAYTLGIHHALEVIDDDDCEVPE